MAKMFVFKVASLCLCLSVAVDVIGYNPPPRLPSEIDAKDCIRKVKATEAEIKRIGDGENPKSLNENCLVTCLWKKSNAMTADGWFLANNTAEYVRLKFQVPEKKMEFVKNLVNLCIIKAAAAANECRVGGYMYKCIGESSDGFYQQYSEEESEELHTPKRPTTRIYFTSET